MNVSVALSTLVASKKNPRRVKPERDAHRRLVASIRAHGLLEPLLVEPPEDGAYRVIAGNRRLAALREVYRSEPDTKIPCITKKVDAVAAEAISLAENFAREPMHPLDEAEAFASLAREDRKGNGGNGGAAAIAEEFGVSQTYVRQRMKLASLTGVVKAALRTGSITLGVAEAFAAVPETRQEELWTELGGSPRSAEQVRAMIEHTWIPAAHALFDVASLPPEAISHDLFGGNVLIERSVFLNAQAEALTAEQARLTDEGWNEVVIAPREEVQDRLYGMDDAPPEYPARIQKRLEKIAARRAELEDTPVESEEDAEAMDAELDRLQEQEREIVAGTEATYGEATKAAGSVFLVVTPDGRVERQYRTPRAAPAGGRGNRNGSENGSDEQADAPATSADLSDRQRAEALTHEVIAVREALTRDKLARKRLVVLALHRKVGGEALAVRRNTAATTTHAESEGFQSALFGIQQQRLEHIDPFAGSSFIDEVEAYQRLASLTEKELDALIGVLVVEAFTGHTQRVTPLVQVLRSELGVHVRASWTPGAAWLSGYRKIQLAHLIGELRGPAHASAALSRKKSELVEELVALFSQAESQPAGLGDDELAMRVNGWRPAPLRGTLELAHAEK